MARYQNKRTEFPDLQISAMRSLFPQFKACKKKKGVEFIGTLQVQPQFPIYEVSIMYRGSLRPHVRVLSPKPVHLAPHMYPDGTLCLYHPDNFKWMGNKLIAKEIIGWTAGWIYFYEVWLQNGNKWIGPEVSHNKMKIDE